ncbi:amidohydrolase [bacterium]|nr:amidohydrolase [bacterium]
MTTIVALLSSLVAPGQPPVPSPARADVVLVGGKIWTGEKDRPQVQSLAVWNDRILQVGTDAELTPLIGPKTQVIQLKGKRVVPGFHDSHLHFLSGGQQLSQVDLKDAGDEAEFGRRLQEFDKKTPRDRWLLGGNWDHDRTFNGVLPTAAVVDKYVKDRPVFIRRYDGHMALANSAALKLAGVTAETKEVPGGVIYRLADGKTPSGILKDNSMSLVNRLIPAPGEEEMSEAALAALRALAESGITSAQDMSGSRELLRILQRLTRTGRMTARLDLHWPGGGRQELTRLGVEDNFGNAYLRLGGIKFFVDGSLGSSTAKMFAPFVGEPKNTGVYVTEPDALKAMVRQADRAGLSVSTHAIGDQANAVLLDIYEQVARENGPRDRRFTIEHVQHLRPQDYQRFKELSVVASMQPYHVIDDGRWAEGRIGKERCASSYAYRSLLDAGAVLAFGSDWPVAPLSVMEGIDAAVNRRTLDGKHPTGWFPEQAITVEQALRAYTWGSAYGAYQDTDRGTLRPGKFADLVVLSRDILDAAERNNIATTQVDLTLVGGKVVFERRN